MKKFFIFIFLLISVLSYGQKGNIQGRVYNAKTNEPLEFATIQIEGTTIGSNSDIDGNFRLTGIDPGFKKLIVTMVGFEKTISPEIQVQGNQTSYIDIEVREASIQLQGVEIMPRITAKRIESPLSVVTIGVQQIEKSAGANRDVSKIVQTLPGVGATDPNRNDLIVRGGGPSENVFYLDGIEIPVINHFSTQGASGGVVGIINPDFVREISFYTGAFPAARPNALSSVMEIRQKDGSKDRLHSKISVGASDAALTLDGPAGKKSTFIISARQSYLQLLFKAIGLPFLPTYNDFQIKYKYSVGLKNELTFIGLGAIDNMTLNTDLQKTGTESQQYLLSYLPVYKQWNYALGTVYKHFSDNYFDTWVLSRNMLRNSNYKYPENDESKPKSSDYRSDEAENKLRFERSYPAFPVKLQFGGGVKHTRYTNYTYRKIFIDGTTRDFDYQTKLNLFAYQAFVQLSDDYIDGKLKLSLGLNTAGNTFNDNMRNPFNQLSPRFSISYALSERLNLNTNIGRYVMQPSYTTMGFKNSNGTFANRNESVRYILSDQVVAGFEYNPQEMIRFTVEGFYKQYNRYPISVADGISIASKGTEYGQVGDEEVISEGKGRAYGVEFLARVMSLGNVDLTSTFTLFRSEFSNSKGLYIPSSWETKSILNITGGYRFGKSWYIAARWRYVGGAPYSPIDWNLSTDKEAWSITSQAYIDYKKFNTLRLKDSHQLDIRIDKEFYFQWLMLNVYADVQNVYNFRSENTPIYTNKDTEGKIMDDPNDPGKRQLLRTLDSFRGTVLPTIGLIVKF
ncbi:TonB-dependent receptor [Proteiniphilum sp. UBA5280]|jgi:outer membrane receptor for ferrienterochelin and colicin|uniref:TonB-dependent receptor n=1 Tax=Proteiniphilum sp. UBA5280 TaxID=1947273 RepID=UPI00257F0A95|nr:TonB-dependent receptor [Proteiniphilum sp. UBA5280]